MMPMTQQYTLYETYTYLDKKNFQLTKKIIKIFKGVFNFMKLLVFFTIFIETNKLFSNVVENNTAINFNIDKDIMKSNIAKLINTDNIAKNINNNIDDRVIFKKKRKLIAEKALHASATFPMAGQLYNWLILKSEDFKKSLVFGIIFAGLIGFYIYNHIRYADPINGDLSINSGYYKRKTYALSFIIIASVASFFDSYLTIYKKTSDFTDNLNCYKTKDFIG